MLDVRRMRVLREVAVRGSFSAAAESLSFTQSAVSQQIAALEREAGCKLVQRNARGIRLTEAGEALVRHADAILARLSEAEAELEAIAGLRGGRLRLAVLRVRRGVADAAGDRGLPRRAPRRRAVADHHRARGPSRSCARRDRPRDRLRSRIRSEVDGIARQHLIADPMFIAMPADHPLAHKRNLRLADLADDAWIASARDCECNRLINRACAIAGFDPRIAFETDDYTAMQGFVAAGVGVSLIAELGLTSVRDDIVVRSLGRETPMREIYAATAPTPTARPATQAMLEILAGVAARYETRRPQLQLVG